RTKANFFEHGLSVLPVSRGAGSTTDPLVISPRPGRRPRLHFDRNENSEVCYMGNVGARKKSPVRFRFDATVIEWRGPAPYFYAPIPAEHVDELRRVAKLVSYGWGCVPVEAKIGQVTFTTSLFPKADTYLLPIKTAVRRKTNVTAGDVVTVLMTIGAVRL
ncbi:MAG TPA: DUF1905 domain-containing protein, partial [Kofleriaceae bacterium]